MKGLTLKEVAKRADTSIATVSRYENGWDRFEIQTVRKLATALRCSLEIGLVDDSSETMQVSDDQVVSQLCRLFWDTRLTGEVLRDHPIWVLERVLEVGSLEDVRLLVSFWGRESFLQRVQTCRISSPRTRSFWKAMMNKEGLTCTRKFFRPEVSPS